MPKTVAILAIGSELLDGRVIDTNSRYIGERVTSLGLNVTAIYTCDDIESEIKNALAFLADRADTLIVLGGLGPTDDDLTREAISYFSNQPLVEDSLWLERIKEFFAERKRTYDESNRKQASIPSGSILIPNPSGTASGFKLILSGTGKTIYSLPGVPSEMEEMFEASVIGELKTEIDTFKGVFRVFGLPEATVGGKIKALSLSKNIKVSYRAKFPEIQVILTSHYDISKECKLAEQAIGAEFIFSKDLLVGIEGALHDLLIKNNLTISTAESCTGGLVAKLLTDTPGASSYFIGGVNSYSNKIKEKILGVSPVSLEEKGAVSESVACEMAEGIRSVFETSIGLSITGTAGPDGGTTEKPVGTFYVGYSTGSGTEAQRFFYPGPRPKVRNYAAYVAVDLIRRKILGLSPLKL